MKTLTLSLGAIALALAAAAPTFAAEPMTKAQMAMAAKCKKLTPAAAKKNAKCAEMMKHDAMMSDGAMAKGDEMMSSDKPK